MRQIELKLNDQERKLLVDANTALSGLLLQLAGADLDVSANEDASREFERRSVDARERREKLRAAVRSARQSFDNDAVSIARSKGIAPVGNIALDPSFEKMAMNAEVAPEVENKADDAKFDLDEPSKQVPTPAVELSAKN